MLTVKQSAERLGLSVPRVHQLISKGRLKAQKFGTVYLIESKDLSADSVINRTNGRPKKEQGS